jgi:hypothetical protein
MNNKGRLLIWIVAVHALVFSASTHCRNDQDRNAANRTYTSQEIGWTMTIPDGWQITSIDRLEELDRKGLEAIEKTVNGSIDYSGLKHLVSFNKDKFNIFQSTIEPFKEEHAGEWDENNRALREVILTTYKQQGIRAAATDISTETIDGIVFQKYEVTIYGPGGEVIIKQLMYSSLVNGYDFGAAITYNNTPDKNTMLEAWQASRFNASTSPVTRAP